MLVLLGKGDALPVSRIAESLDVSVPLLSRHLSVLRAAGLVTEKRSGRQRLYSLQAEPLRELYDWAGLFSGFWAEKMQGLREYLDRTNQPKGKHENAT